MMSFEFLKILRGCLHRETANLMANFPSCPQPTFQNGQLGKNRQLWCPANSLACIVYLSLIQLIWLPMVRTAAPPPLRQASSRACPPQGIEQCATARFAAGNIYVRRMQQEAGDLKACSHFFFDFRPIRLAHKYIRYIGFHPRSKHRA
jgi:hypothetical protein